MPSSFLLYINLTFGTFRLIRIWSFVFHFSRHFSCLYLMGFALISIVLFSLIFASLPSSSVGNLRSWICGTCTICQLCSPCQPHLKVSPKCERHENLNNCNCNCITHKNLYTYYQQWNLKLLATQHNNHAAQMNSNHMKCWLLFWLIGLSCFNILMLIIIILLIIVTPALLRRCADSNSRSHQLRRQQLMKKYNLLEPPPLFVVQFQSQQLSEFHGTNARSVKPSFDDLSPQPAIQAHLAIPLKKDLSASPEMLQINVPK